MKFFSGYEYLLIDVATQYGLDKLTFEERMNWTNSMLAATPTMLEEVTYQAENKPLYQKAVMALRKAQQGLPTGHLVGLDATCSGIQIMSVLTGCVSGANATGLIDPNVRADAYSSTTKKMNDILGGGLTIPRADAKRALMTLEIGVTV